MAMVLVLSFIESFHILGGPIPRPKTGLLLDISSKLPDAVLVLAKFLQTREVDCFFGFDIRIVLDEPFEDLFWVRGEVKEEEVLVDYEFIPVLADDVLAEPLFEYGLEGRVFLVTELCE